MSHRFLPFRAPALLVAALVLAGLPACDTTSPPTPDALAADSGDAQTGTVGQALAEPLVVRVTDSEGEPLGGVGVEWRVEQGGGSVTGDRDRTGSDGRVRATWTLGTAPGEQLASAVVKGLEPAVFRATANVGPAAEMAAHHGDGQQARVGTTLAVPPAVVVMDSYGNRVPGQAVTFRVTAGGGELAGASAVTDDEGVATAGGWTLGPLAGAQTLAATVEGAAPVALRADAWSPTLNLELDHVRLNQGSQTPNAFLQGIAGRAGLLRVIVRANERNLLRPDVRVRLYQHGAFLREITLEAPGSFVPTDPDRGDAYQTWNLPLPSSDLVPGLSVSAELDPDQHVTETDRADNRYPADGTRSLRVASLAPMRVVFVPIASTRHGTTGDIDDGNLTDYLRATRQLIPTAGMDVRIRAAFSSDHNLTTDDGWLRLLADMQALRTAEGAVDHYYHGIIGYFSGIAWGGYAYIPFRSSSPYRSALSYDRLPGATRTIAHEFGHNLGRLHVDCGNPANPDRSYPHPNGAIGEPGYDILSGQLVSGSQYRDFMSYCIPTWTSDHTFSEIMGWRLHDPLAAPAMADRAPTTGLLVWGRMGSHGVTLNPALALQTTPSLPAAPGPNTLRGTTADGRELFRFTFDGTPVADAPDPPERHFAFFIPLSPAEIDDVGRIEVATPTGQRAHVLASSTANTGGAAMGGAGIAVEQEGPGRVRVRWDAAAFPLAAIRDVDTGDILAFARTGEAWVETSGGIERVEVIVSDGVRSARHQVEIR